MEENIHQYDDVENKNKFYKSQIHELEENFRESESVLKEKEESLKNFSTQLEDAKQRLCSLGENVGELNDALELSTLAKEDLAAKALENKKSYESERWVNNKALS